MNIVSYIIHLLVNALRCLPAREKGRVEKQAKTKMNGEKISLRWKKNGQLNLKINCIWREESQTKRKENWIWRKEMKEWKKKQTCKLINESISRGKKWSLMKDK